MNLLISFHSDATEHTMANALSALADIVRDKKHDDDDADRLIDGSFPVKLNDGEIIAYYTFLEEE